MIITHILFISHITFNSDKYKIISIFIFKNNLRYFVKHKLLSKSVSSIVVIIRS
ncbi:hypothetical protein XBFM1_920015 [Xenorhabdus bovienii str. feltiae Moldova]|uniref:Uncharacterized protein n=1 Tax=Xenorhabdus bovienii str. feltiae Moldova TaxID=1398200 RepID=A0A077NPH4_XENBV|nr:hypothetical protein XBFM1_920015 [Xenorhabdus bovienii str. feltiae Moldova]